MIPLQSSPTTKTPSIHSPSKDLSEIPHIKVNANGEFINFSDLEPFITGLKEGKLQTKVVAALVKDAYDKRYLGILNNKVKEPGRFISEDAENMLDALGYRLVRFEDKTVGLAELDTTARLAIVGDTLSSENETQPQLLNKDTAKIVKDYITGKILLKNFDFVLAQKVFINGKVAIREEILTELASARQTTFIAARIDSSLNRRAYLSRGDYSNLNLSGFNFKSANLPMAKFIGSDLNGADLSDADLRKADLTGAALRKTDLTDADLRGADLTGADLTDADLTGARVSTLDQGVKINGRHMSLRALEASGKMKVVLEIPARKVTQD